MFKGYCIIDGETCCVTDEGYYSTRDEAEIEATEWARREPDNVFYIVECTPILEVWIEPQVRMEPAIITE